MLEKIKAFLFAVFAYRYWVLSGEYNKEWDDRLNSLLKTESFTNVTRYYANIGNFKVWFAHHPYASFQYDYSGDNPFIDSRLRPKRYTLYKANRKLIKDYYAEHLVQLFIEKEGLWSQSPMNWHNE